MNVYYVQKGKEDDTLKFSYKERIKRPKYHAIVDRMTRPCAEDTPGFLRRQNHHRPIRASEKASD